MSAAPGSGAPPGAPRAGVKAALGRVRAFGPRAAVVYGSGLAALPSGAVVEDEVGYEELGWVRSAVPGHANRLQLVSVVPAPGASQEVGMAGSATRLRLALACGRPHLYEGWSGEELQRPVADLCAAGATRVVLTNSCGALRGEVEPGTVVVCHTVTDLQAAPAGAEPPALRVCAPAQAEAVATAVAAVVTARSGAYVAIPGPQFETPAEVAWLAGYGDVVGMSAAPELRAARAAGAACCLLGLVANRAGAVASHDEVLDAGTGLRRALAALLPLALAARWPELAASPGA